MKLDSYNDFPHKEIKKSNEKDYYLIIGKVIDMIKWLYPLNHRTDRRINNLFPELFPFFGETTIKDLLGIANTRKEKDITMHQANLLILH